jgi:hypothetical protein
MNLLLSKLLANSTLIMQISTAQLQVFTFNHLWMSVLVRSAMTQLQHLQLQSQETQVFSVVT